MIACQRRVKVSKTDVVGVDVSGWADGEAITTLNVTDSTGFATVNSTLIADSILTASITGVSTGAALLDFEYSTATRNDCVELTVYIVNDC